VPGSITNTIEHLEKHGLVEHEPYRGVRLTAKGERLALEILRRHRLAERLLTDVLHADWSDVHEDACRLEHALSKETTMLLEKHLGYPKFCPHGNPIPNENGMIEEEECRQLTEVGLNEPCIVARITEGKRERLLRLASKGIKPNASVHVIERKRSSLVLRVDGKECNLSDDDASCVCVKIIGGNKHALQK
jgi:DtxR family Mn-dependent transcriptional regulator